MPAVQSALEKVHYPSNTSRVPRSLMDFHKYKGSELRTLLLFGIFAFQEGVPEPQCKREFARFVVTFISRESSVVLRGHVFAYCAEILFYQLETSTLTMICQTHSEDNLFRLCCCSLIKLFKGRWSLRHIDNINFVFDWIDLIEFLVVLFSASEGEFIDHRVSPIVLKRFSSIDSPL
jgi:hypothetical protein